MGDFKAVVGNETDSNLVVKYALGKRNKRRS